MVTTDLHYDPPAMAEGDVILSAAWRSRAGGTEFVNTFDRIRKFAPDVVVSDHARDPRFTAFVPMGVPLLLVTHDYRPHDAANATPILRRVNRALSTRRAAAQVAFSENVADQLRADGHVCHVIPLTSEMPETLTPPLVPAEQRSDFLVVGRLSTYKNVPYVLEAFRRHQASPSYRGDRLCLVGKGDPGCALPAEVEWHNAAFAFQDLAPRLARAKASIATYTAASQSGVQVVSMQCGTATVVSDAGGLAEYLPPTERPVALDDPDSLRRELDRLADPEAAGAAGADHRELYERRHSVVATSKAWADVLATAAHGTSPGSSRRG